ncbi:MAG: hypothetical protein AB7O88_16995 [Reyranellaceae bacterium]
MAKYDSIGGPAASFTPYLEAGEQVRHVAYGVKQPNIFLIIGLVALAVLPGLIAVVLLSREYLVALTDRRVIVLRVKGGKAKVEEMMEYRLAALPPARTSTGAIFTHIRIEDPAKPFIAKFHRAGPVPANRDNAMAIAAALTGQAAVAPVGNAVGGLRPS